MNITVLTFGTRGDVQPLVALGVTLQARGHSVAIGTTPAFAGLIVEAGLEFREVLPPPGIREDLFSQPKMNAAVRKGAGFVRTLRSVTRPTDDEIVTLFTGMAAATKDAALVVTAPGTHIAGFIGDRPWCAVSWMPANATRNFPAYQAKPRFGGAYNKLTHRFYDAFQWTSASWMANRYLKATGGKPVGGKSRFAAMGRDLPMLYPFSSTVVPRPADWPDRAHITGYWFHDRPEWTPDPELAAFTDAGPLLLTLGSTWPFHDGDTAVDHAIAAARAAGRPLLIVGGPERDYPADVHRATEVDYGWLMPRCAAVVHHGGCGTAGAALRAGIPQVSIPVVFDNPFWAARMWALGVSAPPVPLTKLSREALVSAVATALGDGRMRDTAVEVGARMADEKGLTAAADVVESWHAETAAVGPVASEHYGKAERDMIEIAPWGLVEELVHVDGGPRTALAEIVGTHGADAVVAVLVEELRARVDDHACFGRVTLMLEISWDGTVFQHVLEFEAGRVVARPAGAESTDVAVRWALDDLVRRLYPAAGRADRMGWDYEPVWTDRMRTELAAVRAGDRQMSDVRREFDETVATISGASHLVHAATTHGADDLDELAVRFGSDKYGHHHWYTQHYDTHLRPLRDQPVRVLEIGIGGYHDPRSGGESLRMWEQYFRRGLIHGLDIHPKQGVESTRIRTVAGDQGDPAFLARLGAQLGPFDLIIDDGSHVNDHVITSFEALFPYLVDEGYYVVEDTQTAYWPAFGGAPEGSAAPGTSLGFLTRLTDALNHREYRDSEDHVPSRHERSIAAISFYHNMVFVKKAVNGENGWPIWARSQNPGD